MNKQINYNALKDEVKKVSKISEKVNVILPVKKYYGKTFLIESMRKIIGYALESSEDQVIAAGTNGMIRHLKENQDVQPSECISALNELRRIAADYTDEAYDYLGLLIFLCNLGK